MPKLFRITASNPEAYQHYIDTIERGFSLDSIKKFLSGKQVETLQNVYNDRLIHAWGALGGRSNIRTWENLEIGDPVLVYRKGNFEYYAIVTFKLHYQDLARHLWGTDINGNTWEYVYFLDNVSEISVPIRIYNEILGYASDFHPFGFAATDSGRVEKLLERFGTISAFLDYLVEGRWVERDASYTPEIKSEIIQERISRHVGTTTILEANLENILVQDVTQIEDGLKLIGQQVDTFEVGRLDLLCEDKDGALVVVELKRGTAGPSIMDQIQRYMGWAMKHKAKPGQKVRGIIIVASKDTALEYAVKANPLIQARTFSVSIQ